MINPRSRNPQHQKDDLATADASYSGALSPAQIAQIDAIHPNPRAPPIRKICPDPSKLKLTAAVAATNHGINTQAQQPAE